MCREVTSVDELRAIVGHPNAAVANKVGDHLTAAQQHWLAHSPLGFVATTRLLRSMPVAPLLKVERLGANSVSRVLSCSSCTG